MSAAATADARDGRAVAGLADQQWIEIAQVAPQLAATARRYLQQAGTFLAPNSVTVADNALRILAHWLVTNTEIRAVADIGRDDIEEFKIYLTSRQYGDRVRRRRSPGADHFVR